MPSFPITEGEHDPWNSYLRIQYKNTSTREIAAVRFTVSFGDIMAAAAPSVYTYVDEKRIKPGKEKYAEWPDGVYTHNLGRSIKSVVTLNRVVFADGSAWDAPASKPCAWQSR
ncbi:MAG: hypothetical protein ACR2JE_12455 [Acidobacteriaceae bacterium]